jgi:outer membrane immunogenic protein
MKKFLFAALASVALAPPVQAADLPVKAAPVAVAPCSWCGLYIGVAGGGLWMRGLSADWSATNAATQAFTGPAVAAGAQARTFAPDGSGLILGGLIGYNWQFGNMVAGLEADLSWTSARAEQNFTTAVAPFFPAAHQYKLELDWLATIRARLGLLIASQWLAYVTGGVAIAGETVDYRIRFTNNDGARAESIQLDLYPA